jgi:hypothetical protein
MSMTVWLNTRTGDTHESAGEDLSAIFHLQEQISALAKQLGVTSLVDYFDEADVRYNMGEDDSLEESEDGWPASAANWHDAGTVLQSAQTLASHLRANGDIIKEADGWTQELLLKDFEILIPALEEARLEAKSVHLLVVM